MRDRGDDHLGDSHAWFDCKPLSAQIDQRDRDFASVVFVDCAWGIGQGDSVAAGETGSRADLPLVPVGERDGDADWNHRNVARAEISWRVDCCVQVETSCAAGLVGRDMGERGEALDAKGWCHGEAR